MMGRPRLIILIRHAQSEGNKNRDIHQTTPDHRVKLTPEGWSQASAAGSKLRSLLHPNDTLHFFTSPYRRTRETTEGILNSLTSNEPEPSPFPRHTIKVYEEPRLREQDFGNFQPDSAAMARMWQERADYGHFFYRIANGESAADAYDRVSGFNESLWRSFGETDFASVCVLVTHGLMTRVFLMKWYHFSVEYFEDLRNVNHCEFVVMKLNPDNQKYILQNQLRTWSELRREKESPRILQEPQSPIPVRKRWSGCQEGHPPLVARQRRQNTADLFMDEQTSVRNSEARNNSGRGSSPKDQRPSGIGDSGTDGSTYNDPAESQVSSTPAGEKTSKRRTVSPNRLETLRSGRDGGGSRSGAASPHPSEPEDSSVDGKDSIRAAPVGKSSMAKALHGRLGVSGEAAYRARADALGDQSDVEDEEEFAESSHGR